ncbi:hypothetical protein GW17_00044152 [Ensete ventricosum]|nr:hypothetical protein GW17_00044152 [Ensete ventricosum]
MLFSLFPFSHNEHRYLCDAANLDRNDLSLPSLFQCSSSLVVVVLYLSRKNSPIIIATFLYRCLLDPRRCHLPPLSLLTPSLALFH